MTRAFGLVLSLLIPSLAGAQSFLYHTRFYVQDSPGDQTAAQLAFQDNNDGSAGYGCATLTSIASTSNQSVVPSGTPANIAYHVVGRFQVPSGQNGTWAFRYGADFGLGGELLVDGQLLQASWSNLWWNGSWSNPSVLTGTIDLAVGTHTLEIYGFEDCCDGGTGAQFAAPGPTAWMDIDTTNLSVVGTATCTPPLTIQISSGGGPVFDSQNVTYTISYGNSGASGITGATVTLLVPEGETFVSATGGGALVNDSNVVEPTVSWNIGSVAAGANGTVQATLTPLASVTSVTANAFFFADTLDSVEATETDPVTCNGSWCVSVASDAGGGPIAYWPFDGDLQDHSGNGWNATAGDSNFMSGVVDKTQASSANGTTNVTFGAVPLANSSFSIEAWINTPGPSGDEPIVMQCKGDGTQGTDDCLDFIIQQNGVLRLGFGNDEVTGNAHVTGNRWHHVAATFNSGSDSVVLYLDGAVDASGGTNAAFLGNTTTAVGLSLVSALQDFDGLIDEVRIYNYVRSAADIATDAGIYCADLQSDPNNCGVCGRVCAAPTGGTAACAAGACAGTCPANQKRCGGDATSGGGSCIPNSGCCADADCGTIANGTRSCVSNLCQTSCNGGYDLCSGACVAATSTSACGASCTVCSAPANATATCDGTNCGFSCNGGYHACGSSCASDTDPSACGASCTVCPTVANGSAVCSSGSCGIACNNGYDLCSGACVIATSTSACGASCTVCNAPANGTATCDGTSCGFSCNGGYHACGASCAADDDVNKCGASCTQCPTPGDPCQVAVCSSGACGTQAVPNCHQDMGTIVADMAQASGAGDMAGTMRGDLGVDQVPDMAHGGAGGTKPINAAGGCSCDIGGPRSDGSGWTLIGVLLGLALWRRRRSRAA